LRQFETNSGVLKSPERQPFAPSARWRRKINYPLLPGDFDRPEAGAAAGTRSANHVTGGYLLDEFADMTPGSQSNGAQEPEE
jgi:hypothetical protein